MNEIFANRVRRAILDLMTDIGGEHNHVELTLLLNEAGQRVAHRDVKEQLFWLEDAGLVATELLGNFVAARVLEDGRDVADGRLVIEGVAIYKTGE